MKDDFRSRIALEFHRASQISREELYVKSDDPQLPIVCQDDARLPSLGFVGKSYIVGGICLMAINSGGGGDTYTRTPEDEILYTLIEKFKAEDDSIARIKAFEVMSKTYSSQAQEWNIRRIIMPVLKACNSDINSIAYLNTFPFRTRGDNTPHIRALRNSWKFIITPILSILEPSVIITLGKKAGNSICKLYEGNAKVFIIPRTIGDSYVSDSAEKEISEIRKYSSECKYNIQE
jgi:hypothetical protein